MTKIFQFTQKFNTIWIIELQLLKRVFFEFGDIDYNCLWKRKLLSTLRFCIFISTIPLGQSLMSLLSWLKSRCFKRVNLYVHKQAHWEFKDSDGSYESYPTDINAIIEQAFKSKVGFAQWEENDGQFKIDFKTNIEENLKNQQKTEVRRIGDGKLNNASQAYLLANNLFVGLPAQICLHK